MAFSFTTGKSFYEPGMLYLGCDQKRRLYGIRTERHAITIAGSGTGKGVALLIPNARRWPHSLLCVDPKGENAEHSWEAREAMGQKVYVLDPFKIAKVPDRLRAAFNPLTAIDADSMTGREDIEAIADGLVKVHDPKHMEWVEGARAILSGIMAYVIAEAPPEHRTFESMRRLLLQPDKIEVSEGEEPQGLYADAQRMMMQSAFGGLPIEAGSTIQTALDSTKGLERDFLGGARRATRWLDSKPVAETLNRSTFDLSDLANGTTSIYLVLPPQYLETHSSYLRLFVRCALNTMAQSGSKERPCLFLLDEFFALGKINEIAVAAGLMRSYGVQLWPFLQDLGQLLVLYGHDGAHTFFSNADAHIFFGNSDAPTLNYISERFGKFDLSDMPAPPKLQQVWNPNDTHTVMKNENARLAYQHQVQNIGKSRLAPEAIKATVARNELPVADSMFVFGKGSDVFHLGLVPYFWEEKVFTISPGTNDFINSPIMDYISRNPNKNHLFETISSLGGGLAIADAMDKNQLFFFPNFHIMNFVFIWLISAAILVLLFMAITGKWNNQ